MFIKKEFYFIRHGQTDYNVSNHKVDHEDVSLNAVGFQQAKDIEPIIANLPIRSVCCSPLKRAKETKEVISKRLQSMHYDMPELGECSLQIWRDMTECGSSAWQSSYEHVKIFMQQTLDGINQALSYEGPVLIVAHGGVHWAMCCLMGIENHGWVIDNCLPVHFFPKDHLWTAKKLVTL